MTLVKRVPYGVIAENVKQLGHSTKKHSMK